MPESKTGTEQRSSPDVFRSYSTDLKPGDTGKTADGMLHRVLEVALMVSIQPYGDTSAAPMMVPAYTVTKFTDRTDTEPLTAYEAKCIRIALSFGDPAAVDLPDEDLERAKAKLAFIEQRGGGIPPREG